MRRVCSLLLVVCVGTTSVGCGSDSDGGASSCGGKGTFQLTAGPYGGTASVGTVIGDVSSTRFSILTEACTGDAVGSLYDIPTAPGTYSFTTSTGGSGSFAIGPNLTLGLPGPDYTLGFDSTLDCAPCGTGSITVVEVARHTSRASCRGRLGKSTLCPGRAESPEIQT